MDNVTGKLAALWGVVGISALLGFAIIRLAPYAVELKSYDLFWYHWLAIFLNVMFMGFAEGYRGFQQQFSPRVAARARYLMYHPDFLHAILAPLFCMAFFHAPKRRKIISASLTAGIICLVIIVRMVPQPWRGVIDTGVVVGLLWGLISLLIFSFHALTSERFDHSPEVV